MSYAKIRVKERKYEMGFFADQWPFLFSVEKETLLLEEGLRDCSGSHARVKTVKENFEKRRRRNFDPKKKSQEVLKK